MRLIGLVAFLLRIVGEILELRDVDVQRVPEIAVLLEILIDVVLKGRHLADLVVQGIVVGAGQGRRGEGFEAVGVEDNRDVEARVGGQVAGAFLVHAGNRKIYPTAVGA